MNNKIYAYFYSNEDNICIIVRGHWKISRKGNKVRKKRKYSKQDLGNYFYASCSERLSNDSTEQLIFRSCITC